MNSEYSIEIQRPVARRGNSKLIIIAFDSNGVEVFRDKADLNEEKFRKKVAVRLASITGESLDEIDIKILDLLGQLPQPSPRAGTAVSPGVDSIPYEATPGGILWNKETPDGIIPTPLTTFTALITGQVVEDDGAETKRLLEIEATSRNRQFKFQVPSGQFTAMSWPMEHIGAGAALWPGIGIRDHARAAIQFLSGEPPERTVYAHLGWRLIAGTWCYLHAGGAIGPMGPMDGIEVSLPPDLQRYQLPEPPTGDGLKNAVRSSLSMLDVAGDKVTVPVYCATWRAVLGKCDCGIHLEGRTGAGKTEMAALGQQHFGPEMNARMLPGSWASTDNALEGQAFLVKDSLLVVDDFCPTGSQYDVQAMHRKGDRLYRGQGNASGRARMRADGTLRPTKSPRGIVLGTGEDVPRGQSLRTRILVLEMPQSGLGSMDFDKLGQCQADAASGMYAQAMAAFLRWLASRYEDTQKYLGAEIDALRKDAYQNNQHRRTPNVVANLGVGLKTFLKFALESGAITQAESDAIWQRCWMALGNAAAAQQGHQTDSDPVNRFLELLSAAISSGRAHLSNDDGDAPKLAGSWGWREVVVGTGDYTRTEWRPHGENIGWIDGGEIYLQSDSTYAVVQRLAKDGGDQLPVTLATLKKRLRERGLLASTEKYLSEGREVERLEVRRVLQGKRRTVLHFNSGSWSQASSESVPSVPSEPSPKESYLTEEEYGSLNGSQTVDQAANVSHGIEPPVAVAAPGQRSSGAHGTHGSQNTLDDLLAEERSAAPDHWEEEV